MQKNSREEGMMMPPEQVSTLMHVLNRNFIHILPKKRVFMPEASRHDQISPKICLELIDQYEITLQLLVQNILFCDDMETKQTSTRIFLEVINKKNEILEQIFLPAYDICLDDFKFGNNELKSLTQAFTSRLNNGDKMRATGETRLNNSFMPQVSIFQATLLDLDYKIVNFAKKNFPRENSVDFLMSLGPFIRRDWIATNKEEPAASRTKFSQVDDALLLLGMKKLGSKNLDLIKYYFLRDKSTREIKNRYKNLIRKKTNSNAIKNWKALQYAPLTELEKINLQKGIVWFGEENMHKIARYFLPNRSPDFLYSDMVGDKRLLGKREKCRYMYEDLNIDCIAIELNHDLYQDKRKHGDGQNIDQDAAFYVPLAQPNQGYMAQQINSNMVMHEYEESEGCPSQDHQEGIPEIEQNMMQNGVYRRKELAIGLKGAYQPSRIVGVTVPTPLALQNKNIEIMHFHDGRQPEELVPQYSSFQGLSSYPYSSTAFMAENRRLVQRAAHQSSAANDYSQGFPMAPKMNSLSFNRMADISINDFDTNFRDGQIVSSNSHRYRSVRGVLYQIMEEIEEYELLLK